MMKPRNQRTFDALLGWLASFEGEAPAPFEVDTVNELRPRVLKAYAAYQQNPRERSGDVMVDALVQVAGKRSDAGMGMPFSAALNQVLDELTGVDDGEHEPGAADELTGVDDGASSDEAANGGSEAAAAPRSSTQGRGRTRRR